MRILSHEASTENIYGLLKKNTVVSYFAKKLVGAVTRVETGDNILALTFDDGPHPEFTPILLQILAEHDARATFFVVGEAAERYPELLARVSSSGHTVGNHSYSHLPFTMISHRERISQVLRCEKAIAPFGMRYFRPPYGYQGLFSRLDLTFLRYEVVTWNIDAFDWLDRSPEDICERLVRQLRPGSIVLFHDSFCDPLRGSYLSRERMLEAVKLLLTSLGGRYRFLSLPELFRSGRPVREIWYRKAGGSRNDPDKNTGHGGPSGL
jgi:peptidoglycan/xylan/chitin deacetylase (PgdA/CDA1 family)